MSNAAHAGAMGRIQAIMIDTIAIGIIVTTITAMAIIAIDTTLAPIVLVAGGTTEDSLRLRERKRIKRHTI